MNPIDTFKIFDGEIIAASGSSETSAICLKDYTSNGMLSLQNTMTGTGTAKITFTQCSTLEGTYVLPEGGADIKTTQAGAGSWLGSFSADLAPFIKIKITETGGVAGIVCNTWLNVQ
jgi:hypothetical protein